MDDDSTMFATIELFLAEAKMPPHEAQSTALVHTKSTHLSSNQSPRPVKERRKRHIEIQLLRDQVTQLEALRSVLAQRQQGSSPETAQSTSDLAQWKALAVNELQKREQAMATNLELRKLVRSRVDLARRVFKQIGQQQRLINRELTDETKAQDKTNPISGLESGPANAFHPEPMIYSHLDQQTIRLYERTDKALDHPRLPTMNSLVARLREMRELDGSPFLDSIDARLVPFELGATARAVWQWLSSAHSIIFQQHVDHINVVDDHTVLVSFTASFESVPAPFHGNAVIRRFDEPDRVVFVRATLADQPTSSADGFFDHLVHHSEWIVLYRPVDEEHHVLPQCTEIVVRNLAEYDQEGTSTRESHQGVFTVLTRYLDLMHEYVDNMLLDIH